MEQGDQLTLLVGEFYVDGYQPFKQFFLDQVQFTGPFLSVRKSQWIEVLCDSCARSGF
jgi:hypothetical protein